MEIKDLNDNLPIFERPSYKMDISEYSAAGATVGIVKATDRDIGYNGIVAYKFLQADIGNDIFNLLVILQCYHC